MLLATEGGDWGNDDRAVVMKENPDDWSVCEVVDAVRHWTTGLSCTMRKTNFGTWTLMWKWKCYRMMTPLSI